MTLASTATYYTEPEAALLARHYVDVDAEVRAAHQTQQAWVMRAANAHNRALDLLSGRGDYQGAWASAPAAWVDSAGRTRPPAYDPGPTVVYLRDILTEARICAHWARWNVDMVRHRLGRLAQIAPDHPLIVHAQVLVDRCWVPGVAAEVWPELAGAEQV